MCIKFKLYNNSRECNNLSILLLLVAPLYKGVSIKVPIKTLCALVCNKFKSNVRNKFISKYIRPYHLQETVKVLENEVFGQICSTYNPQTNSILLSNAF